tara:strand:+ start:819 stop:1250 length:432 start_codon:yes stop_codon:yes gene_type:complete
LKQSFESCQKVDTNRVHCEKCKRDITNEINQLNNSPILDADKQEQLLKLYTKYYECMEKQIQTRKTRETDASILEKNIAAFKRLIDKQSNFLMYCKHVCQVGSDPDKNCIKLVGPTCGVKQESRPRPKVSKLNLPEFLQKLDN